MGTPALVAGAELSWPCLPPGPGQAEPHAEPHRVHGLRDNAQRSQPHRAAVPRLGGALPAAGHPHPEAPAGECLTFPSGCSGPGGRVLGDGSLRRVVPRGTGTCPLCCPALAWAELMSQTSTSPVQGWFGIAPDAEVREEVALRHLAVGSPPGAGAGGLAQVRILEAWFWFSCSFGTFTLGADAGGSPALKHRVSLIGDQTFLLPSRILMGICYLFSY